MSAGEPRGRIAYRVRVGVTGHRDLRPDPALTKQVRDALQRVREIAASSGSTPLRLAVVSPLAEGADRIVARVALEDPEAILEAPLPMPEEEYTKDFETEESKREFRDLLDGAAAVSVQPDSGTREQAYERVGRYVVDSCDVVIALWDGQPSQGKGGTAEIVDYARRRKVPLIWIDTGSDFALNQKLHGGIPDDAFRELAKYNTGGLGRVDLETSVSERTARLLPVAHEATLPREYLLPFCEWILPHYVRADALADRAQALYHLFGNTVLFAAGGAVLAVAAQTVLAPEHPQLAFIEVGLMALALLVVAAGRWRRPHARWLAYRFLAERFRSALYLALAGVWGQREAPPEQIRRGTRETAEEEQERRDDWVPRAFLEVWAGRPGPPSSEALTVGLKGFLGIAWIDDQVEYHRKVGERYRRRHARLTRASYVLFAATLVGAGVHALDFGGPESHEGFGWSNLVIVLSIGLPAVAGTLGAFHAQREYERNSERSRGMVRRLEAAKERLERATDLAGVRAAAWDIEQVMIDENDDWLVTMRFQDIKARV